MNKGKRFWAALVIFSIVGQIAWVVENMYFNVFIYKMFRASAADIATMVAASAVAATLTTVFMGALSDKIGRRRILICFGYIAWGISILLFAFIRTDLIAAMFPTAAAASVAITLVIVMDCVMTFFGSTANDAAFNAWLTDATAEGGRGAAEGINSMMPLVAILVVFGSFMSFDLSQAADWSTIFAIIGTLVIAIGVSGFFLISETGIVTTENRRYWGNIVYGFRPRVIAQNPTLYATLAAFAVFGISIQVFMPYLILYYNVTLAMDNYVLIMAPAILIAALVTAFFGRLYDKVRFFGAILPAMAFLIVGYVILALFTQIPAVFLGSLLMMCGYLCGMAVFGAMIREKTPPNRAGMFQGLRIVAQVLIPGVIGPMIGRMVLQNAGQHLNDDGTYSFIPDRTIFVAAAIVVLFVLALLPVIRRLSEKEASRS